MDSELYSAAHSLLFDLHGSDTADELIEFSLVTIANRIRADRSYWGIFRNDGVAQFKEWRSDSRASRNQKIDRFRGIFQPDQIAFFKKGGIIGSKELRQVQRSDACPFPKGEGDLSSVPIDCTPFGFRQLFYWRSATGFSTHEEELLELLVPHIQKAYRRLLDTQRRLEAFESTVDAFSDSEPWLSVDKELYVVDASEKCIELLRTISCFDGLRLTGDIGSLFSNRIEKGLPIREEIDVGGRRCRLFCNPSKGGDFHYLSFGELETSSEEVSDRRSVLTPRQREIVSWIEKGKTHSEIGTILNISQRTVEKHVENIYERLGVSNRFSLIEGGCR